MINVNELSFPLVRKESACSQDPNFLAQLATHLSPGIRERVAGNSHTSLKTLRKLANDQDAEVRAAALGNENIPLSVLKKAAKADKDTGFILMAIAENPNATFDLIKSFKIHEELYDVDLSRFFSSEDELEVYRTYFGDDVYQTHEDFKGTFEDLYNLIKITTKNPAK